MRLGRRTKDLLELILALGVDCLEGLARGRGAFYSGWESDSAFERQLKQIRERGLIEDDPDRGSDWVEALTKKGRALADLSLQPEEEWNSSWDGRWRLATFDLKRRERNARHHLENWFQSKRFGALQGSVRITHRPYQRWAGQIEELEINPESILFIDGNAIGALEPTKIVSSAWDFDEVNNRYREWEQFIQNTQPPLFETANTQNFIDWFRAEYEEWRAAYRLDPFLPEPLLPKDYLGKEALDRRSRLYGELRSHLTHER